MPASKTLEISLCCAYSPRSALSDDIKNDHVCDKVEKKSVSLLSHVEHGMF
jgi:hypothetical protein